MTYLAAEAREIAVQQGPAWLARYMHRCHKPGMLIADLTESELRGLMLAALLEPPPPARDSMSVFAMPRPGGGVARHPPSRARRKRAPSSA